MYIYRQVGVFKSKWWLRPQNQLLASNKGKTARWWSEHMLLCWAWWDSGWDPVCVKPNVVYVWDRGVRLEIRWLVGPRVLLNPTNIDSYGYWWTLRWGGKNWWIWVCPQSNRQFEWHTNELMLRILTRCCYTSFWQPIKRYRRSALGHLWSFCVS